MGLIWIIADNPRKNCFKHSLRAVLKNKIPEFALANFWDLFAGASLLWIIVDNPRKITKQSLRAVLKNKIPEFAQANFWDLFAGVSLLGIIADNPIYYFEAKLPKYQNQDPPSTRGYKNHDIGNRNRS